MTRCRALMLAGLATVALTSLARAYQDDNTESMNPRVVPATECVAEPRSGEELTDVLALDDNGVTAPAWPTVTAPLGQSLDAPEAIPIKEAVREILACFNAGDLPRAAALMTDNGVIRTYWQLTETPDLRARAKDVLAAVAPRPERAQIRLIAATDISRRPDGRIVVFAVINDPLALKQGPETLLFYFQQQDDDWKLDDWVDFSVAPLPAAPPAA